MTTSILNARRTEYCDNIKDLVKNYPSILQEMFPIMPAESSNAYYIDHYDDVEAADDNVNLPTGEQIANPADLAEFLANRTQHKNLTYQRTLITPVVSDWGHIYTTQDTWETILSNTKVVEFGVRRVMELIEKRIISALSADTVSRQDATDSPVADPFPAGQQTGGVLLGDVAFPEILEDSTIFEINSNMDEDVMCLVHPSVKQALLENDTTTFASSDFISNSRPVQDGQLPQIGNVSFIVHTYAPTDKMIYFQKSALERREWKAFETVIDNSIDEKNVLKAYMSVVENAVRVDDKRVVIRDVPAV